MDGHFERLVVGLAKDEPVKGLARRKRFESEAKGEQLVGVRLHPFETRVHLLFGRYVGAEVAKQRQIADEREIDQMCEHRVRFDDHQALQRPTAVHPCDSIVGVRQKSSADEMQLPQSAASLEELQQNNPRNPVTDDHFAYVREQVSEPLKDLLSAVQEPEHGVIVRLPDGELRADLQSVGGDVVSVHLDQWLVEVIVGELQPLQVELDSVEQDRQARSNSTQRKAAPTRIIRADRVVVRLIDIRGSIWRGSVRCSVSQSAICCANRSVMGRSKAGVEVLEKSNLMSRERGAEDVGEVSRAHI